MSPTRREFLHTTLAAGGALTLGLASDLAGSTLSLPRQKIRLLILGGTGFIGPHQVRYAVERGHDITIFNRGRRAPGMFPGVEEVLGDRAINDYASLKGKTWDAVIDNSASGATTAQQWVREAASVLKDSAGQFLFISTRSVFRDLSMAPATVDAPLLTPATDAQYLRNQRPSYGLGKALAEGEAKSAFGDRATIVRPGLIVGPGDDTDRFTYWPVRIDRGGEVLAPGDPNVDRVQVIDVRDLCEWVVRLCEQKTFGTFMAVGPNHGRTMGDTLRGIGQVVKAPHTFTWIPREFLSQHNLHAYAEMPMWRPPTPGFEGFARFDLSREIAAGLTFRTIQDTARATLDFHYSRPLERQQQLRAGITAEREAEVLKAWHATGK